MKKSRIILDVFERQEYYCNGLPFPKSYAHQALDAIIEFTRKLPNAQVYNHIIDLETTDTGRKATEYNVSDWEKENPITVPILKFVWYVDIYYQENSGLKFTNFLKPTNFGCPTCSGEYGTGHGRCESCGRII